MPLFVSLCPVPTAESPGAAHIAESTAARDMLKKALVAAGLPAETPLAKEPSGRPYLPELPHVAVSLTHTHTHALAALLVSSPGSTPRVGIDAEPLSSLAPERARRVATGFFAPGEKALFEASGCAPLTFLEIFTRKEAFAKYRGTGFGATQHEDTAAPDFAASCGVRFLTRIRGDLCITVCLPADLPETNFD